MIAYLEKLGTWENGILWTWAMHRMNHGGKGHTWALFGFHLAFIRFKHLPAICPTSASPCPSTLQQQIQNIDFLRTCKLVHLILQGANCKLLAIDSNISWPPLHGYSTYSDKRKSESPDALRVFNNLELQKPTFKYSYLSWLVVTIQCLFSQNLKENLTMLTISYYKQHWLDLEGSGRRWLNIRLGTRSPRMYIYTFIFCYNTFLIR